MRSLDLENEPPASVRPQKGSADPLTSIASTSYCTLSTPPPRGSFILEYERMKRIQNPPAREPGRWHRIRPTVFLLRERRSSDQWITPSTVVNQSAGSGCAFSQNAELHHGPEMLLDPEMSTVKLCRPTMVSVSTVHGGNEGWTHVIRMAEV